MASVYRRVMVLGAGAVGGYIGAHLHACGIDVTLIDTWDAQVQAVGAHGLKIDAPEGQQTFDVRIAHLDSLTGETAPPDLMLLCAKLYDTERVLARLLACGKPVTPIITIQNSLVEDLIAHHVGSALVLGGIATGLNVELVRPGHIRRYSRRRSKLVFQVGEVSGGVTARSQSVAQLLQHVDQAQAIDDLMSRRWQKLTLNALTSGLCAVSALPVTQLYRHAVGQRIIARLGCEAFDVVEALGVPALPVLGLSAQQWRSAIEDTDGIAGRALRSALEQAAAADLGGFRSGMLQDMLRGRQTEVEYFNGYVARRAAECGVPAKAHAAVARRVRDLTGNTAELGPQQLFDIAAAIGEY